MVGDMKKEEALRQSEIGMLPFDWDVIKIGEIGTISKGKNVPRSELRPEGIPCVLYGEIYTKYHFIAEALTSRTSPITAKNSFEIKKGDILFAGSGETAEEIGKCFAYLGEGTAVAGGDILILRPTSDFHSGFLGYILNSEISVSQKQFMGQGSSVYHIYSSSLRNLQIPLPPTKAEQTAIATALSDMDALIAGLEKLLEKKRLIKQGAMQELLKPKEGWVEKKLGDCLLRDPDYGINAPAVSYNESLPAYLRITDITEDGRFSKANKVSISNLQAFRYYLEDGDLVFARTGASVGKTYLYNSKDGRLVFAGFLIRITTNPIILNSTYFFYFTQTTQYWNWIKTNSMRTGQPGVNGKEYRDMTLSIPEVKEQEMIAGCLNDMDAEIEQLERQLSKYKQLKTGMMQELLTGKKRLYH